MALPRWRPRVPRLLTAVLVCAALSGCYTVTLSEWAFEHQTPVVLAAKAWKLPTPDGEFAVFLDYENLPDEWVVWLPTERSGMGTFGEVWRFGMRDFELPAGAQPVNVTVSPRVPSRRGYWDPANYTLEVSTQGLYRVRGPFYPQRALWFPIALPFAFAFDVVSSPVQLPLWVLVALDGWPREWPLGTEQDE